MRRPDAHANVGGALRAAIPSSPLAPRGIQGGLVADRRPSPTSSPFSSAVSQICTRSAIRQTILSPGGGEGVKSTISTLSSPPSGERRKRVRGRDPIGKLFQLYKTSLTQRRSVPICFWVFIFLLLVLCTSSAQADFRKSDWQFFKAIDMNSARAGGYLRFSLDGDVFHQSRLSLADLRILDDQQKEVPYALFEPRETTSEEQYTPRMFNQAVLPKAYSTLTLDLGQETYNNKLVLKTRSKNFKRRVEIV